MIINAYFTNGYLGWGRLFLESFAYHNGQEKKMILNTRNLTKKEINGLYPLYKNLEVRNTDFNFKQMAKRAGVSVQTLINYKRVVESNKVHKDNRVWKLMVAGDDRIKTIYGILNEMDEGDCLVHFDIDTYVQGNLDKLFEISRNNYFTSIFRIDKQIKRRGKVFRENRAILICVMGFTIGKYSKEFVKRWIHYIDKVPPVKRQKGYGQTSCYYAYKDMNKKYKDIKWGQVRGVKEAKRWMNANKGSKSQLLNKAIKHFNGVKNGK